jgi:hypothetical protein
MRPPILGTKSLNGVGGVVDAIVAIGVVDAVVVMPAMLVADCTGLLAVSGSACSVVSAASGTGAVVVDSTSGSGISKSSKGEIPELVGDGSSEILVVLLSAQRGALAH